MQALTDLRNHLLDNKALNLDPENLISFVEEAQVYTVPGPDKDLNGQTPEDSNQDFQLQYEALIYIFETTVDPRYICWIIGEWMNKFQSDHSLGDIKFEADIRRQDKIEYEFRLRLKEDVKVNIQTGGVSLTSCLNQRQFGDPHGAIIAENPGGPENNPNT